MCRVDERIYINAQGHRSKFEEAFPCDKATKRRLCANVTKRTTEYYPNKRGSLRDDTPLPITPPTPTGTGPYRVEQRRPSSSGGRPSTRDGSKPKPIVIEFSGKNKKGKNYVSVSTGSYRQSSDDVAIESPSSDTSHLVHTGLPEAPLAPPGAIYGHPDAYITTPTISQGYHHRQTSSTSSYTGSSRTPSLYVTSDGYDSPTQTRASKLQPSIHQTYTAAAPPSPGRSGAHGRTSSYDYNLAPVAPRGHSHDSRSQDNDYHDFADRSASSHASSGASGHSRRRKESEQPRKGHDEEEENRKQVRFELGRANSRKESRAESKLAESEKQRAIDRDEARRQKERDREEEAAKLRRKEKSRSSTTKTRRESASMTSVQREEQRRLLAAELDHMKVEERAAEAREREEAAALLRQKQQDTSYYNPRAGGTSSSAPGIARRNSTTRRDSLTSDTARPILGRTNSHRRTSIVQPTLQPINTQVAQGYGPPSARTRGAPPVSFPSNFNTRPTSSSRRPSLSSQDRPYIENPFLTTASMTSPPAVIHQDPWDARNMHDALPTTRQIVDDRYTKVSGSHSAAQQATRAMGRAAGYDGEYVTDSDDEITQGHHRRRHNN
jgi:hypothetical protein